jgi:hypothetical protein
MAQRRVTVRVLMIAVAILGLVTWSATMLRRRANYLELAGQSGLQEMLSASERTRRLKFFEEVEQTSDPVLDQVRRALMAEADLYARDSEK